VHRLIVGSLILIAIAPEARGQEQDYNEDRLTLPKVPAAVLRLAEKEAPGVQFSTVYKNQEKEYRLVGRKDDGKTVSVRVDRDFKLLTVRTTSDLPLARLPRAVAGSLQVELRKRLEYNGFTPARVSQVDLFDAASKATSTFFEVFGANSKGLHHEFRIGPAGNVLRTKEVMVHPSYYIQRKSVAIAALPEAARMGAAEVAPGVRFTRAYLEVNARSGLEPDYVLSGRGDRGRGVEVRLHPTGKAFIVKNQVPLGEVPPAVLDAVGRQNRGDLKGFRPTQAWRMRLLAFDENKVVFLIYGDDAEGKPVEVRVEADGDTDVSDDPRPEVYTAAPGAIAAESIPAQGFAVLAARFGREAHWVDVTDRVRPGVSDGMLDMKPNDFPDPAFGSHKGLAIAYSDDGKVGLWVTRDDQKVELPPPAVEANRAEVPPRGFAVLAARYGSEGKWDDVTDAVRSRISGGRVEVAIADLKLPDPFPNTLKAMAVVYSVDGKVGLSVVPENRPISLPPEGPPLNSSSLEVRRLEFTHQVTGVAFTPDGRQVVAGIGDGTVRVLDVATGREALRLEGHAPGGVAVAVSSSGNLVLSGGVDHELRLRDLKLGRERAIFRGHTNTITNVTLSPNGRLAASGSWDKTARIWEVATGKPLHVLAGHAKVVMGVAFTPDGRQLATTSWDQSVRIWDVATGREVRKTEGENGLIGDVALSKDGRQVYFGAKDGKFKWWEPATGNAPGEASIFMGCSWSIAPFPDGRRILFTDENAAVVWDFRTKRTILRLDRHTAQVVTVAVSTDGRRAATGSQDRSVRIWNVPEAGR
jgi:DNA-binding beta-propeller fold protein YncE